MGQYKNIDVYLPTSYEVDPVPKYYFAEYLIGGGEDGGEWFYSIRQGRSEHVLQVVSVDAVCPAGVDVEAGGVVEAVQERP